jgi:uncharacterized protein (TIGR03086 family)
VDGLIDRHRRACDGFARVTALVPDGRWSSATPCTEWDARAVVEHVIGFHEFLLLRPLGVRAQRPRDDPAARWRATSDALFGALDAPGVLDHATALPGGGQSAPRTMLAALTTDVLVHTWDLAVARGVDPRLDPDLCERALDALGDHDPGGGDGALVGPAIAIAAGAPLTDRLVARYGRDPGWRARQP